MPLTPSDDDHPSDFRDGELVHRCDSCGSIADWRHLAWNIYSCDDCAEWIVHPFDPADWEFIDWDDDEEDGLDPVPPAQTVESLMEEHAMMILARLAKKNMHVVTVSGLDQFDTLESQTS